ncbi:hypothetical protein [Peribacillus glennii]|uniref:hypothetical protein n=1 Tax=Peribacillus glennii TaxID=2303991 RepID=UPI0018F1B856|nr:hypothetical protein [Peribacillus glennii]
MKFSEKGQTSINGENQLLGVDFHDFIQKEQGANLIELASEFGLTMRDARNLKRRLGRS